MSVHPPGDHSTLEVVRGADYAKEVVPAPALDNYQKHHSVPPHPPQHEQSGLIWFSGGTVAREKRATILGMKRRTFFIMAWVTSLLVAIAIGVGAGLGATLGSRNSRGSAGAGTNSSGDSITAADASPGREASTIPTTSLPAEKTSSGAATTLTTKLTTTSSPLASSAPTTTSSVKVGGVGGRCSNEWGGDCICLDRGICENKWKGTPYTGYEGNWPCPYDLSNIMACVIKPCLGKLEPAQCLWKEACRELNPGTFLFRIC